MAAARDGRVEGDVSRKKKVKIRTIRPERATPVRRLAPRVWIRFWHHPPRLPASFVKKQLGKVFKERAMSTFGLIEYQDASPEVKAIYDDIMAMRKTDWINNF